MDCKNNIRNERTQNEIVRNQQKVAPMEEKQLGWFGYVHSNNAGGQNGKEDVTCEKLRKERKSKIYIRGVNQELSNEQIVNLDRKEWERISRSKGNKLSSNGLTVGMPNDLVN